MWKKTVVVFLLTYGIANHMSSYHGQQSAMPSIQLDEYWGTKEASNVDQSIRPFKIDVSQDVINELKERLNKTRTLMKPLEGTGWRYGVNGTYLQTILEYWKTQYDWNERQRLLNKYPQYKTNIQGLDIHFYHVKPTIPQNSSTRILPILLMHGWPGSVVEFQKIIPMLTTPRPDREFVFETIIPSLPGYIFSDGADRPGFGIAQITIVLKNLMSRLGFEQFYLQGGDWGTALTSYFSALFPKSVLGQHCNMCVAFNEKALAWYIVGNFFPSLVVSNEHWSKAYPLKHHWGLNFEDFGYLYIQSTKPDTVGIGLSDSPAGLAAYILDKFSTSTNKNNRHNHTGRLLESFTIDELLDNIMLYWVTNSITTSMRLYAEFFNATQLKTGLVRLPVQTPTGCAHFPNDIIYQPESVLRYKYENLIYMSHLPRGGHFAALEVPQLLADDVWTFVSLIENSEK